MAIPTAKSVELPALGPTETGLTAAVADSARGREKVFVDAGE